MMKSFSTVRDTHRSSQSYTEKRRGRRETEVTRRRRGEIRKRETDPASNQFPKCSPQPRTHKEIHRVWGCCVFIFIRFYAHFEFFFDFFCYLLVIQKSVV